MGLWTFGGKRHLAMLRGSADVVFLYPEGEIMPFYVIGKHARTGRLNGNHLYLVLFENSLEVPATTNLELSLRP